MKKKLFDYLISLGFVKMKSALVTSSDINGERQPIHIEFYRPGKLECLVLPTGAFTKANWNYIRKSLVNWGYITENYFDDMFDPKINITKVKDKYVYVVYDPLDEKVLCVHSKSDIECDCCMQIRSDRAKLGAYHLYESKHIIVCK